jgi:hypothetical protein
MDNGGGVTLGIDAVLSDTYVQGLILDMWISWREKVSPTIRNSTTGVDMTWEEVRRTTGCMGLLCDLYPNKLFRTAYCVAGRRRLTGEVVGAGLWRAVKFETEDDFIEKINEKLMTDWISPLSEGENCVLHEESADARRPLVVREVEQLEGIHLGEIYADLFPIPPYDLDGEEFG